MDYNRGSAAWLIHCTDTDIYAWWCLPKTSQVENSYISELTWIYAILEFLVSVCKLYQLQKGEI